MPTIDFMSQRRTVATCNWRVTITLVDGVSSRSLPLA